MFDELLAQANTLRAAKIRGRYAPSPTGPLHLGNLRTALVAWLQVRLCEGRFILRMEDIDQPRVKAGSAEQILDDLRWLGLDWDEGPDIDGPVGPYAQSQRLELYEQALHRLHLDARLFPCFCSRKDIASAASAPHGATMRYPGTCRDIGPDGVDAQRRRKGRPPVWRYRVPEKHIRFDDQVAGWVEQTLHDDVGDFVLKRADELFAYQLAVVVDDVLMGVTDVVRGRDLLDSTPRQIELFEALGATTRPRFWHVPLVCDASGARLAKRDGADSVAQWRQQGLRPEDIVGRMAASLGLIGEERPVSARQLLEGLDLEKFRRLLRRAAECSLAAAKA